MGKCDQLITFIKVVDLGSFNAVGDKLGISGTAVSKQITLLEEVMGVKLIQRSTRNLKLTEVGQNIYQHALQLEENINAINQYVSSTQTIPQGTLNLAASNTAGTKLLIPILNKLLEKYHLLDVDVKITDHFPDFSTQKIDIAYGYPMEVVPTSASNLICRKITYGQRILCASPNYLARRGNPISYLDFPKHCYIAHNERRGDFIINQCIKQCVNFERIFYFNNTNAMFLAVINNMGMGYLSNYQIADTLACKKLIAIMPSLRESGIPVYLFYQKSRYLLPKIAKFLELALECHKQPLPNDRDFLKVSKT